MEKEFKNLDKYEVELNNIQFEKDLVIPHRNVLIQKIRNTKKGDKSAFKKEEDVEKFILPYLNYIKELKEIENNFKENKDENLRIKLMLESFEKYQKTARKLNRSSKGLYFAAQSKYESTILEEFIILLLSSLIFKNLKIGSVKLASQETKSITTNEKGDFLTQKSIDYKDQDTAIYFEDENKEKVLLVGIEIKSSYIDKTMLNSITDVFKQVHKQNKSALTIVATESVTIDDKYIFNELIPIYNLKKTDKRDPESKIPYALDVFEKMYEDVKNHIEKIKQIKLTDKEKLIKNGYL